MPSFKGKIKDKQLGIIEYIKSVVLAVPQSTANTRVNVDDNDDRPTTGGAGGEEANYLNATKGLSLDADPRP